MIKLVVSAVVIAVFASSTYAQTGPANAKKPTPAQKLAPVLPAQPPQVSTGTKPSMVGVPAEQFRPPPPKLKIKEPPPPPKRN